MEAFLKIGKSEINNQTKSSKSQEINEIQPWIEKYRPKSVDDVVEQNEVIAMLKESLNGTDLPNLLLYGPPGTGKTSTILAAARQLFGDMYKDRILELNASDERGINIVRTKIKNFAQLTASAVRPDGKPCPPFKIIILDEADSMTHAAQAALRRTMERESHTTRFCLVCNYVSRIIEPITSRCSKFRFKSLPNVHIIQRLKYICNQERIHLQNDAYDEVDVLKTIVDISGGDMRRAITILQCCYRLKGDSSDNAFIASSDVLEISGYVPVKYLRTFIDICITGNYTALEEYASDMIYEAYSIGQFFEQLNDYIIMNKDISNKNKSKLLDKLSECCYRLENGASEYLQIMDLGCTSIVCFNNRL